MPNRPPIVKTFSRNPARPSSHKPNRTDYGKRHQQLREQVLALYPFCQKCGKEFSEEAHHLEYPATGVKSYLALCKKCHYAEHNYKHDSSMGH